MEELYRRCVSSIWRGAVASPHVLRIEHGVLLKRDILLGMIRAYRYGFATMFIIIIAAFFAIAANRALAAEPVATAPIPPLVPVADPGPSSDDQLPLPLPQTSSEVSTRPTAEGSNLQKALPAECDSLFHLPNGTSLQFSYDSKYLNADLCNAYSDLLKRYSLGKCSSKGITDLKEGIVKLNPDFALALDKMLKDMDKQSVPVTIISAYRSTAAQECANKDVTDSSHEHGCAVDFNYDQNSCNSIQCKWIKANAHTYGLQMRLQYAPEWNHIEPGNSIADVNACKAKQPGGGVNPRPAVYGVSQNSTPSPAPPPAPTSLKPFANSQKSGGLLSSLFGGNGSGGLGNMMQMMMGMQLMKGLFNNNSATPAPAPATTLASNPAPLPQPVPLQTPVSTTPASGTSPIDQLLKSLNTPGTNTNNSPTTTPVTVQVSTSSVGQITQPSDTVISSSTLAASSSQLQGQLDTISIQLQQATASIAIASSSGSPSAVTGALNNIGSALSSIQAFLASLIGR